MNTFKNVLIFDRDQCQYHGGRGNKPLQSDYRESPPRSQCDAEESGGVAVLNSGGRLTLGFDLHDRYHQLVSEDLPEAVLGVLTELQRQLEKRGND